MSFSAKQTEQLLRPVNPKRVQRDNNGMSHLAAYDVSAHLTRIFGFGGWEKRITSLELVSEQGTEKSGRTGWWVTYRCQMTLIVKDPSGAVIWSNDDGATGSASNLPGRGDAHDFAMKNAISYALKRCAKDLGDQFGLSLYNKGSLKPLVGRVLSLDEDGDVESAIPDEMHPDADASGEPEAQDARPATPEPGNDAEAAAVTAETAPPAARPPGDDPVLGQWALKVEGIASQEDVNEALEDVDREQRGGVLDSGRANAIRGAIREKAAGLRQQNARKPRPPGPPATERGAQPVPTGKGDDGPWVTGFMERLGGASEDELGDLQSQIGNAVRAKTITPGKSAELSKAIRERRYELQKVPA